MVKDCNARVTFTTSNKVAKFVKSRGGSKFINRCICDFVYHCSDIPLEVWRDLFLEFDFYD